MNKAKTIQISKKSGEMTPHQLRNLKKALSELSDGNYVVRIEPNDIVGNPRGRYFSVVGLVASELGWQKDDLHQEFKIRFNDGQSTSIFKSDLEWSDFLNQVLVYCKTVLEINLPDSKDFTYEKWLRMDDQTKQQIKI